MADQPVLWAVMKAHPWSKLQVHGQPLRCPIQGPQRFIPVFDTREQAVEWNGSDEHVEMLMLVVPDANT